MEIEFYDFNIFGKKKKQANAITDAKSVQAVTDGGQIDFSNEKTPIIQFTDKAADDWTLGDAVRGTQIFGSIGSGKTSGSGSTIALQFIAHGFGGLVLCGKPSEAKTWISYARQCGREKDVIHFKEDSGHFFNPLQYERNRQDAGGGLTSNISNLFINLYKLGQRANGGGDAQEGERFWDASLKRCLNRVIDLIKMSGEELSVYNMVQIVASMPDADEMQSIRSLAVEEVLEYGENNYCVKCMYLADQNCDKDNHEEVRDFDLIYSYFFKEMPKLYPETRTTIQEMFRGLAEPFLTGLLAKHFAQGLTIKPEQTHEGKIIIVDFSVKQYLEAGIYAQGIFKLIWQQATERREVEKHTVPVFLWVDESQYFINEYDMLFQTTARSSRACTVFLTQNISNYYAVLGGMNSRARVDSLLGNLCTKIFHSNNDYVTNEWASNLIGRTFQHKESVNVNLSGESPSFGGGTSSQIHYQVEPIEFTTLRCGGDENEFLVDGYLATASKTWSSGKNYFKYSFPQNFGE
jgi:hypothetical protein